MELKLPRVYNAERHEHTGKDGGAISLNLQLEFVESVEKKE